MNFVLVTLGLAVMQIQQAHASPASSHQTMDLPHGLIQVTSPPGVNNIHLLTEESFLEVRGGASFSSLYNTNQRRALWWQSLFARPKQYREALEEQIQWLEQQIRQVMEEKRVLSKKQKSEKLASLKSSSSENLHQNEKRELTLLEEQLRDLIDGKRALEDLLQEQQEKIAKLTQLCKESHANRGELQASYQKEVDTLEGELEAQTKEQLSRLDSLLEQRIDQAQERARQQVWDESQERINSFSSRLASEYHVELEKEREKTTHNIEKQRYKMRALAKAMAIREKKIFQQAQAQERADQQRQRAAQQRIEQQRLQQERMEQQRIEQLRRQEQQVREEQQRIEHQQKQKERQEREQWERLEQQRIEQHKLLLQQREIMAQERLQAEQQQEPSIKVSSSSSDESPTPATLSRNPFSKSFWGRWKTSPSKKPPKKVQAITPPTTHKAACWQRHVMWQPASLPPQDIAKMTFD